MVIDVVREDLSRNDETGRITLPGQVFVSLKRDYAVFKLQRQILVSLNHDSAVFGLQRQILVSLRRVYVVFEFPGQVLCACTHDVRVV
ncbi:hypothetical protein BW12_01740 [Bifidobacterium sp. UTCIF-3]|nr:hypothetical protein BW09_07935 [Bifidobacterium sp. UTCIF-1]TPF80241.1 hypothetical protein BW08_05640 [Bifidobacterium sp. UTCIF-24]TPF83063.1 hypothetical protein BW12_01740 [Bifidobacterium sp. UTCIF-3]TPF84201.1 hypothetical protein BW07_05985 [Bifidobacterium sp. UTCIF-36]TPF90733.1 hypothetical protein BW10_02430 [Bifidobacterium sp. UTBIF-56]